MSECPYPFHRLRERLGWSVEHKSSADNEPGQPYGEPEVRAPWVAHRGYAQHYPENTRESLIAAIKVGAAFVEFDIQFSADGVPVLLHDSTLDRTAGCSGSVFDFDAATLARIEVNEPARLGDAFTGVHIPLLSDIAAELACWPGVTAFVEIKQESLERMGHSFTIERVLSALGNAIDQCIVISFSEKAVRLARQHSECRIGWALHEWSEQYRQTAIELAPEYLFCNHRKLPPAPAPLWAGPWSWVVYEVADLELAASLFGRGVHLLETMAIAEMMGADTPHQPPVTGADVA